MLLGAFKIKNLVLAYATFTLLASLNAIKLIGFMYTSDRPERDPNIRMLNYAKQ